MPLFDRGQRRVGGGEGAVGQVESESGLFASFTANYVPRAHLVPNRISELIVPSVFGIAVLFALVVVVVVVGAIVFGAGCCGRGPTDAIRDNNPFSSVWLGSAPARQ